MNAYMAKGGEIMHIKKSVSALMAAAVAVSGFTSIPVSANTNTDGVTPIIEGDTVIQEWKFDFGTAENVMDGYTPVTPDRNVIISKDYGFIGNDGMGSYVSNRYDSFNYKPNQTMKLAAGGSGETDGIGIVKDETAVFPEFTTGDYFPVSFGLYVDNGSYYRVRATVTTLDPAKDAVASLYSERRHPVFNKETIKAGETKTVEFSVDVESIYFEKSLPKGVFVDDMLNIELLGDNAALSSLVIQKVEESENTPTVWICGDSTVTDGPADVPYFDLQNYTGVGAYISKYLPKNIAVSNHAEGGLDAYDNNHFNIVKDNIKKGDYLYVEYGHNHKDDGPAGYVSCLPKYYDACKSVGAALIVVGPMDRHNSDQYNSAENKWSSTLSEYSKVGKAYVDAIKYGGTDAAAEFINKYKTDTTAAYSYVDELKTTGEVVNTDVAFVDINRYSLDWLATVSASGTVAGAQVTNSQKLTNFYYTTLKGSSSTDGTHPNDAGADALAYGFVTSADMEEYPLLAPLLEERTNGTLKMPVPVPQSVLDAGYPSNASWPIWPSTVQAEYPVRIDNIEVGEDGTIASVDVTVQESEIAMDAYGIIIITVTDPEGALKGYFYANNQVDNSTGTGKQTITGFRASVDGLTIGENDLYTAQVWKAKDEGGVITVDEEANQPYSAVYTPFEVEKYLIGGCLDCDYVNFDYNGATYDGQTTELTSADSKWVYGGSSGKDLYLNKEGDIKYTKIKNTGSGNSWYLMRALDESMTYTGKLMIDADIMYNSGSSATFEFADGYKTNSPFVESAIPAFEIGSDGKVTMGGAEVGQLPSYSWTNVHYVLDMDTATASISINGGTPKVTDVENYDSLSIPAIDNLSAFVIAGGKQTAFDINVANLKVAKLKTNSSSSEKTLTVKTDDSARGSVLIKEANDVTYKAAQHTIATIIASPAEGYEFSGWYIGDEVLSFTEEASVRMFKDAEITAKFNVVESDNINYLYKEDFTKLTTDTMAESGWDGPNVKWSIASDAEHGNYAYYTCGGGNDRSGHNLSFGITTTEDYIFETDFMFHQSNNHANNSFVIANTETGTSANANPSNYILKLATSAAYSQAMYINGTDKSVEIPDKTWVHIKAVVHKADNTVDLTITNGDNVLYEGTGFAAVGGTDIAGVHVMSARYYSSFALDNIKVYPASALTSSSISVADGKISINVSEAEKVSVFVASYNGDGSLKSLQVKNADLIAGNNDIDGIAANTGDKVFAWKQDGNCTPVADSFTVE